MYPKTQQIRAEKKRAAEVIQAARQERTDAEQVSLIKDRRGESKKELKRLQKTPTGK
jgi:hypothetical protein